MASALVLVLGHPAEEYRETHRAEATLKALGVGAVDTVAKFFEFFTNTLSYVRLGVLLITTTLLETLTADVMRSGVPGLVIGVVLNLCVIGLEGVIVYVQDMRLQVYEWFSQFYAGTGIPFLPLTSGGPHFTVNWR